MDALETARQSAGRGGHLFTIEEAEDIDKALEAGRTELPGTKPWTVIGVFDNTDEVVADYVWADDADDAEEDAEETRGSSADYRVIAVLNGHQEVKKSAPRI